MAARRPPLVLELVLVLALTAPSAAASALPVALEDVVPERFRGPEVSDRGDRRELVGTEGLLAIAPAPPSDRNDRVRVAVPVTVVPSVVEPVFATSMPVPEPMGRARIPSSGAPPPLAVAAAPPPPATGPVSDAGEGAPAIGPRDAAPDSASTDGAPRASAATTAAAALAGVALTLLLAPLFSRLTAGRALDHPRRAAIHALLRERPGRTAQEIADALGLHLDIVRHHLRRLARLGLVRHVESGRRRRFTVPGAIVDAAREDALAVPVARALVDVVAREPGATLAELARRTGRSPSLCHHHLRRLAAAGAVVAEGEGRARRYRPA